jgi:hypothetical protein
VDPPEDSGYSNMTCCLSEEEEEEEEEEEGEWALGFVDPDSATNPANACEEWLSEAIVSAELYLFDFRMAGNPALGHQFRRILVAKNRVKYFKYGECIASTELCL